MGTYRYSFSLRLRHPSMDPETITTAIGLVPSRSWRAGDPRSTPKGTPLEGMNKETYWTAAICKGALPETPLPDAIAISLDNLSDKRSFLNRVRSEGGTVELFIGWYFDGQSGDTFSHHLMARAADLGIDFALDIYP
jgi:hypothetical protein